MPDSHKGGISDEAVREQMEKILASKPFGSAIRSRRFLEYVVDRTLIGEQDAIKEYTIAIEVFGRKESYDSREHSAVRVEAARLRTRLQQYYDGPGREDPIFIELPKGGYVPRFLPRQPEQTMPPPVEIALPKTRASWRWVAAGLALASVIGIWIAMRPHPQQQYRYRNLIDLPGQERSPAISADGSAIVYSRRQGQYWKIFIRRQTGKEIDLTPDSPSDNTQPAISPDGRRVAFRSSRDGGGIFVVAASGGVPERISDFGFNPAWSPDGTATACASEQVLRPDQRLGVQSSLWLIDVASHRPRQIYAGDAVQPAWSPSGKRIAFWRAFSNGQMLSRDVWTIASDGSDAKPVTSDEPIDWAPQWSPDGRYLYFLSDRGGAMNLWRVAIDESSGRVESAPEPETTPSSEMWVFSFARTAPKMVYENRAMQGRLIAKRARGEELRTVVAMPAARQPVGPDLSPDGKWLTFYSIGEQEDIYVVRSDGSELRQLTDDAFADRGPRWSPDAKTIAFTSARSGRKEIWTIHQDGSGLAQFTKTEGPEPIQAVWSPDGRRIAYSRTDGASAIADVATGKTETLPARGFFVRSWSPDGKKLVGQSAAAENNAARMVEYDLGTGRTRELGSGNGQTWTPDGRFVLFERGGKIFRIDPASLREDELASFEGSSITGQRLSLDGWIYAAVMTIQSDLWIREPAR